MKFFKTETLTLLLKGPSPTLYPVTLTHKNIFILPSKFGLIFSLMMVVMLFTAINYQNNLAYATVFIIGSSYFLSLIHSYLNFLNITIIPTTAKPVFAGEKACFFLILENFSLKEKQSLFFKMKNNIVGHIDKIPSKSKSVIKIFVPAYKRGSLPLEEMTLYSTYPFGLFYVWTKVKFDITCTVYPKPIFLKSHLLKNFIKGNGLGLDENIHLGTEEFWELKEYEKGESYKKIDWKKSAKDLDKLWQKNFIANTGAEVILDFQKLPSSMDTEEKLSILCGFIVNLFHEKIPFGLKLPNKEFPINLSKQHTHSCLKALAFFKS